VVVMDVLPDAWAWAEQTFANADLGDPRRSRRLIQSAGRIAAHPEKAFTQVFDWNELRGFYRLCDQWAATTAAVQMPHWQQTRQAMSQQPLVLILHDTTELDYSRHHRLGGRGQIGNEHGKGFMQHNSLAVLPQPRQVLGLAFQQWKVRSPPPRAKPPIAASGGNANPTCGPTASAAWGRPPRPAARSTSATGAAMTTRRCVPRDSCAITSCFGPTKIVWCL
jgi:Transposase DNA-binding